MGGTESHLGHVSIDEERDGEWWHNSMFLEPRTHVHRGVHFGRSRVWDFKAVILDSWNVFAEKENSLVHVLR